MSARDVWTLGWIAVGGHASQLIEHWDGAAWMILRLPTPPQSAITSLRAITARATDDVWAVGESTLTETQQETQAVIYHWDGSNWQLIPSPAVAGSSLWSVTAVRPDTAWAVGMVQGSHFVRRALVEYWNGQTWQVLHDPAIQRATVWLQAVSASSAQDVWAVGDAPLAPDGKHSTRQPLILHGRSTGWEQITGPSGVELRSVAAWAADDVWAVGSSGFGGGEVIAHWDGARWNAVPFPALGPAERFNAVAASARDDAWVVGMRQQGRPILDPYSSLILHWDGQQWHNLPSPSPSEQTYFTAAAGLGNQELWTVGETRPAHWTVDGALDKGTFGLHQVEDPAQGVIAHFVSAPCWFR
ncbi:MAG TPA: hypothetical protein VKY74_21755 [Chloroflexia bacterium]|nr:hypothetical protein [Chloroflexia bacterium]